MHSVIDALCLYACVGVLSRIARQFRQLMPTPPALGPAVQPTLHNHASRLSTVSLPTQLKAIGHLSRSEGTGGLGQHRPIKVILVRDGYDVVLDRHKVQSISCALLPSNRLDCPG